VVLVLKDLITALLVVSDRDGVDVPRSALFLPGMLAPLAFFGRLSGRLCKQERVALTAAVKAVIFYSYDYDSFLSARFLWSLVWSLVQAESCAAQVCSALFLPGMLAPLASFGRLSGRLCKQESCAS